MSQVEKVESSFTFRTNKESGYKRPTVVVNYPAPTVDGIVALVTSKKEDGTLTPHAELIKELVQGALTGYVRGLVDNDSEFSQDKLDVLIAEGKITLEAIANLPRSERNVLSKEDLEDFAKDYIRVMSAQEGANEGKVKAAAGLFVDRFKRVAGDNDVLAVLQARLGSFVEAAGEEVLAAHEKAINFLLKKLEELLSVKVTADSL